MIELNKISARAPEDAVKSAVKKKTRQMAKEIGNLLLRIYAEKKHAVLIVLQGMDASGKDGIAKALFTHSTPLATKAYGFKKPTEEEFAHDFLWRVQKHAPRKGHVQLFIRSHYEDILIQRVHKWIDEDRVQKRMKAINDWEELLVNDNNTTIIKFYLHLSRKRQKEKLIERTQVPRKYWKHNPGDMEEAQHWEEYMRCYQDAMNWSRIPWTIIPCDQRWWRNYTAAAHVLEVLRSLNPQYPPLSEDA